MTSIKLISTAKTTAIISFIGGTLIFLLFYFTNAVALGFLGLGYTIIAGIINLVIVVRLFLRTKQDKLNSKRILNTIGLMLLNIPILLFYCWLAIVLLNTVRITFINATSIQLDNIKVDGCEQKLIDKLSAGQSKTLWINIPNDCGVSITYKLKGQIKTEDVTGYVTNENGYIMTFKIGTNQKPYDADL